MEPPTCTVCCDSINVDTKGMFMPCGHVYHPDCLQPWLENHNSCPVCRFELPLEEAEWKVYLIIVSPLANYVNFDSTSNKMVKKIGYINQNYEKDISSFKEDDK